MEELRRKDGIPINPKVVQDLQELATTFSLKF
jgi:LDH2 family malate/lactate/ureidoglycolate dehydrogenase